MSEVRSFVANVKIKNLKAVCRLEMMCDELDATKEQIVTTAILKYYEQNFELKRKDKQNEMQK